MIFVKEYEKKELEMRLRCDGEMILITLDTIPGRFLGDFNQLSDLKIDPIDLVLIGYYLEIKSL